MGMKINETRSKNDSKKKQVENTSSFVEKVFSSATHNRRKMQEYTICRSFRSIHSLEATLLGMPRKWNRKNAFTDTLCFLNFGSLNTFPSRSIESNELESVFMEASNMKIIFLDKNYDRRVHCGTSLR